MCDGPTPYESGEIDATDWGYQRLASQPHHPIEAVVSQPLPKQGHPVYRPAHYTDGGIEAIDFIRAKLGDDGFVAYAIGNAMKYLSHAGKKETLTHDLEKAKVYMGWAIDALRGRPLSK